MTRAPMSVLKGVFEVECLPFPSFGMWLLGSPFAGMGSKTRIPTFAGSPTDIANIPLGTIFTVVLLCFDSVLW